MNNGLFQQPGQLPQQPALPQLPAIPGQQPMNEQAPGPYYTGNPIVDKYIHAFIGS